MARKPFSQLSRDARYRINLAVRKAAVEIMNDLAEAGPVYSGELRDSWIAIPVGKGARGSVGGGYPYTLSQVPQLSITVRELDRKIKFTIENTAAHAEYALDLAEGFFIPPEFERDEPMPGNVIVQGSRSNPSFRGEVTPGGTTKSGEQGRAESSAPQDWYVNYLDGGGLQNALGRGVRLGFKQSSVET
jgi:hypothetical protein